jgi:Fic family protein
MTQAPPYTITLKSADYLAKIVETVTRLEVRTGWGRDIQLHSQNRVRSIYSSLAIEGNTLSLDEVTDVLNGKLVAGKQAEIKEVKNAFEAYDRIMAFDPYKVKDFIKAHKLMTDGLVAESGKFRSGDVGVFDGDVLIHPGARPQFVPELISDLLGWAKETELHPIIKSAVVHSEIETIHPFADGNGRTGRLWQTLILAKWNPLFEWIPMETVVYEKRQEYYDALHAAQNANNSSVFTEFILSALLETVEAQSRLQAKPNEGKNEFVEKNRPGGTHWRCQRRPLGYQESGRQSEATIDYTRL